MSDSSVRPTAAQSSSTQSSSARLRPTYPQARRSDHTDDYFGETVADPYRWLEDPNSPETQAFVEAQNVLSRSVLDALPLRGELLTRLTGLWDYARRSAPWERGGRYFQFRNSGLENQNVLYVMDTPAGEGSVLLDPNTFSEDGTVSLAGLAVSPDGEWLAYAVSSGGSDWQEWRVRGVQSGTDLPERLGDSKFCLAAWLPDSSGFFYNRYDPPAEGQTYTGATLNARVWLHRLGTDMAQDEPVLERRDQPEWGFSSQVTEDGAYLVVGITHGTARENQLWVSAASGGPFAALVDEFRASYEVVGNDGPVLYVLTDETAPLGRLLAWNVETGERRELVPEGAARLDHALPVKGGFVLHTLQDASSRLTLVDRDGQRPRPVELPGLGTVNELKGRQSSAEVFVGFTSFLTPPGSYRLNLGTATLDPLWTPDLGLDLSGYEARQEFAESPDGTRVPLFIVGQTAVLDAGPAPTLLYGYGGFDISLTPTFEVSRLAWLERGGVLAVANLRGGGEYGESWHRAGTLANKQNVFDDFAACARHLAVQGYTTAAQLGIEGGSNGGLLVGATLVQSPQLIGAAVAHVGVLDMLRFQHFTIGWAWASDYGSSGTPEGYAALKQYSPLHTLKPAAYPATLLTTGDHDDRVVPAHSYKFAAQLQRDQQGGAPVLLSVQTRAGHGAGKPARLVIEEKADVYAFLFAELGEK
ncbi:prolyl oligopeptidase family serine peptidase [Deinococcus altitudinis]|uniref:prolyl oligopeptidase family serine peptidase n=1 Tax=Deinococcus altitudinis TaxID=468914 RepID=UPI00389264E0